jgi:hypothetical protein
VKHGSNIPDRISQHFPVTSSELALLSHWKRTEITEKIQPEILLLYSGDFSHLSGKLQ